MSRPLKNEQIAKAIEIENSKTRADIYRWWEIDNGRKLGLLEYAFKLDATDKEACLCAEITLDQLYYYQREIDNTFQLKKEQWKETPTLLARTELVNGLKGNAELCLKYLERKKKGEFSLRQEYSGPDGKELGVVILPKRDDIDSAENTLAAAEEAGDSSCSNG